jgi:acetyl-CoA synthetase
MPMPRLPAWFRPDRWVPPPGYAAGCNITRLLRASGANDYDELHRRSVAEPEWFYPAAFGDLGLGWLKPFEAVVDRAEHPSEDRWFPGGATNLGWLCADRHSRADGPAVLWEAEDGATLTMSRRELAETVRQAAAGLGSAGVRLGDVVTLVLPMIPEAVVALLAVARIGAIAAPCFSGFGPDAIAERMSLSSSRFLIYADGTIRRGRPVDIRATVEAALVQLPWPVTAVEIPRLGTRATGRAVTPWARLLDHQADGAVTGFDADTPFLLAFTSGSAGRPKGAVHVHGGFTYQDALMLGYAFDLRPADRLCWVTDLGWVMGPVTILGTLALGGTLVLLEGAADAQPGRIWRVADEVGLTHLGVSPTLVRQLMADGDDPAAARDLDRLRVLGSTGEPWTQSAWRWLHARVGRGRIPIINLSGGTETGGILVGSPIIATREGAFSGPMLGMPAQVLDADGRPVTGVPGELVLTGSWPSMTRGLWRDRSRFLSGYYGRWPRVWVHGDLAVRHADGSWEILGRSDDVIKVAGKRIGPAEMESVATQVDGVAAAAAVGIAHPVKGEIAVIVVVAGDEAAGEQLPEQVARRIERALGRAFRPGAVVVAHELPLTRSGKIHRRAVRQWLTGQPAGDLSTVDNPAAQAAIEAARPALEAGLG